jgi:hypothetical protein
VPGRCSPSLLTHDLRSVVADSHFRGSRPISTVVMEWFAPQRQRGVVRALVAAALVLAPRPAAAIPVFARIYDKPCSACHTVYPQLNPEGERFRERGLHGFTPAIKPIRVAPGLEVPGTLPLAISLALGEDVGKVDVPGVNDRTENHQNLEFLGLLAGGELGPHLAFLADYAPLFSNPRTGETDVGTRPGLAFMQAHADVGGWLANFRGGAFELPLGASPRVHRLSVQRYLVYGVNAFSLLGRLPPTRGRREDTLLLSSTQIGGELSAVEPVSDTSLALGVVAGSNNRKDNNAAKDVYVRVGRGFGFHHASFFAYYSPDVLGLGAHDEVVRFGPDLTLYWRRGRIVAQALAGYDTDPAGHGPGLWHYGGFVEGNLRLTPLLLALLRFDHVRMPLTFDDRAEGGGTHVRRRIWEVTGGMQLLLDENLKLITEATYGANDEAVRHRRVESWSVTVRLATAFWPLTPPVIGRWLGGGSGT